MSRTPEENARTLLAALPKGPCLFDVVTHSRGGLVLRTLVEDAAALGPNASRFQLGRAILVASPNDGTPLASPNRFQDLLNWLSNLMDLFPENPFTTAAEFLTEGLAWLAHAVQVDIPGLAAMNSQGPVIHQLQGPPGPPPTRLFSAGSKLRARPRFVAAHAGRWRRSRFSDGQRSGRSQRRRLARGHWHYTGDRR